MSLSSDQLIKQEIIDTIGYSVGKLKLRIFPESSNFDQQLFCDGGLTFGANKLQYGSCDAVWFVDVDKYEDPYTHKIYNKKPVVALEGTDALERGSSGDAQYQRFHHALGAIKSNVIGVYYLRPGKSKIRPDLFFMAYQASKYEKGIYLIINDLNVLKQLLETIDRYGTKSPEFVEFIKKQKDNMKNIWDEYFNKEYGSWDVFSEKRSTIVKKDYVIKYAGRMRRNFTDSSQRAGHIAVGEMYLTKYFFPDHKTVYLLPRMTHADVKYLDQHKMNDKEWRLLRLEPNVDIATMDDIINLPDILRNRLVAISDQPLKGDALQIYRDCVKEIVNGLNQGTIKINFDTLLPNPV
jgi:hypothetical protein